MTFSNGDRISRRALLVSASVATVATALPSWAVGAAATHDVRLVAKPGTIQLIGGAHRQTSVWSYNGKVPGPEIRARQGDRLRVAVENRLGQETTVHWHGLRVPNAMDGVPHLTQRPIAPGETFHYEFDLPDAGTYWYHPHQRGFEQVARGLYGPLIVEEREPPLVDRDLTWVLDDWRLLKDAQISDDFGNRHDMSHSGRVGNTVTINGRIQESIPARSGERIRLRLINAANARIFGLDFAGLAPRIIAYDGQPVTPHDAPQGRVVLGPAMRVDLLIDMTGKPGDRHSINDTFYQRLNYHLVDFILQGDPKGSVAGGAIAMLPANTLPEPDIANAERHEVTFGGGMMGGMRSAMMGGRPVDMREMMHDGKAWAINGVVATGHLMEPLLTLRRGRSHILTLDNATAWHHPIHLHGHSFRVISRNGSPTPHREWQDTVLMAPREKIEIAFVADNPGDWMFHCHILEHQAGGMMGVIRVTET